MSQCGNIKLRGTILKSKKFTNLYKCSIKPVTDITLFLTKFSQYKVEISIKNNADIIKNKTEEYFFLTFTLSSHISI